MKRFFISISVLFSAVFFAQQYNYNFEQFGNKSILLLGNVTAGVDDLGLAYYNPSRLAFVKDPKFMINARAYKLRKISIKGVDETEAGSSASSFNAIPTMAAGSFKINDEKFVYSFISKANFNNNLGIDIPAVTKDYYASIPGDETYKGRLNIGNSINEELIGLTWGKKLGDNFSVGITGFASIYKNSGSSVSSYTIEHSTNRLGYMENGIGFEQRSYGILTKLGLSYSTPKVELGMNISLPYLEVKNKAKFKYKYLVAGIDSNTDVLSDHQLNKLSSKRKSPLGLDLGASFNMGKNRFHLKTSWYNSLNSYNRIDLSGLDIQNANYQEFAFKEKLKSVFNYGAAAEIYLNKNINGYVGFSTDFSPVEEVVQNNVYNFNTNDLNLNADFYHYSLGIDLKQSWANIFIGTTYSRASSSFDSALSLPDITEKDTQTKYKQELWRFMVGVDIPLFEEKIKNLIK